MDFQQIFSLLQRYDGLSVLLSLPVCGLTALVKRFCPASCKKFLTLLPFLLGTAALAVCGLVTEPDSFDWQSAVESGLRCGSAATVFYVVYEQFVRGKRNSLPAEPDALAVYALLLQAGIPGDICEMATRIAEACRGLDEPAAEEKVRSLLRESLADEETCELLVRLIAAVVTAP